ncbi:DHH family phosphoesterase [Candidatus Woesearchaeota archaeon]|nr:DHH family phosphoesterase [Candidatus Woesearchaeota archaeon]
MDSYAEFRQSVALAADRFKELDRKETIRVISHLDADGISACAILIKTLNLLNRKYSISIIPQLNEKIITELKEENHRNYFFTDLGSGQIKLIRKYLQDKNIFILDHHEAADETPLPENIVHVNPHINGIDGSKEISGAGVVYLFGKMLSEKLDLAHVAIIGAIGDIQETKDGFLRLNDEILQDAVKDGKIQVKKGIRFFGRQTRPLHKVLEYSTDPYIPGVSGSESAAIQFLHQIGINPKIDGQWKKVAGLTEPEVKKLIAGIVMKRINEENPEDILGNVYTLIHEERESPTRDAKEFATLLNACGRLNKASLGIGACLGDKRIKQKAISQLASYKRAIIDAMKWYNSNKGTGNIILDKKFVIINAGENIPATMIGTVASIISKSSEFADGTMILSMARADDGTTKVSLRVASKSHRKEMSSDLRDLVSEITRQVGGEAGGHQYAAGAIISPEDEEKFIETAKTVLSRHSLEENLVESES